MRKIINHYALFIAIGLTAVLGLLVILNIVALEVAKIVVRIIGI